MKAHSIQECAFFLMAGDGGRGRPVFSVFRPSNGWTGMIYVDVGLDWGINDGYALSGGG